MQRVILHCDMNNFYASVECMLNPELKNKPVAVCGSVEERHGIVAFRHKALPIWRKPHFFCLQRIISGNTRFVR